METVLSLIAGVTAAGASRPRGPEECALLEKARELAGYRIGEIAARLGCELPANLRSDKGAVGRVIEKVLGAHPTATIDFERIGVECKTVPVRGDGAPRESTFLTKLPPNTQWCAWSDSAARMKIARVLFVPVELDPVIPLASRRVGRAFLWSPSDALERVFEEDFERIGERVAQYGWESLSGRLGEALQARPKARRASDRVRGLGSDGHSEPIHPRALYLRPWVTGRAIAECLRAGER